MQASRSPTMRRPSCSRRPRRATSARPRSPGCDPATPTSPGALKYGFNDVRNVLERASARETAARVAAGGVARAFLRELGIEVWSFTAEVGGVAVDPARRRARATRPTRRPALPGP